MVDNWFIENVVADINAGNMNNSIHCAELLSALVLWDKIYCNIYYERTIE